MSEEFNSCPLPSRNWCFGNLNYHKTLMSLTLKDYREESPTVDVTTGLKNYESGVRTLYKGQVIGPRTLTIKDSMLRSL